MRLYIWGSLCSITNYCMNSYLVLQVTTAYASKLVSRFAFQEADWLGPTDSRFWLVERRQGLVVLHWSGYCTQFLSLPQCLFMCRERWSDLQGLVSNTSLALLSLGKNSNFSQRKFDTCLLDGWGKADLLNCRAHKWHLNGFWPEKKKLFK